MELENTLVSGTSVERLAGLSPASTGVKESCPAVSHGFTNREEYKVVGKKVSVTQININPMGINSRN